MGKTSKWIRNIFLPGHSKKDKRETRGSLIENPITTPISALPTTPKEKRRWSFRRSGGGGAPVVAEPEDEQKKHALAVVAATAAAADAAVAAAQAAAAVIRLTTVGRRGSAVEEVAAVKIQSVFRGYLARKALSALRGLVKLQALVRGHLVRKQAAATLRCMQALVTVQARARMQRIKLNDEYSLNQLPNNGNYQRQLNHRKSTQENRYRPVYNEMDKGMEENIKIVEMDYGESKPTTKSRNSCYSNYSQTERTDHRFSTQSAPNRVYIPKPDQRDMSPAPSAISALTEMMSPRGCSNHFEEYCFNTTLSPQYYSAISKPHEYSEFGPTSFAYQDHPFYPSYMANTQSSRAKARSQSAPKSRPENSTPPFERQSSKRRPSIEGRNVPRAVRMQRSSSHVGATAQNYHYPWAVKLDKSSASIKDSECGSTSTILTNPQ